MRLPIRLHIEDLPAPARSRESTVYVDEQLHPLRVEWPAGDDTVLLHTFDNVRRSASTYAMGREEALALADALRRAALS